MHPPSLPSAPSISSSAGAKLKAKRFSTAASVLDGCIYVTGGYDGSYLQARGEGRGGEGRGGEGGCTGAGRTWEACAVLPESVDGCVLHSMKVDNGIFCKFCLELVQTQGVDWRRRSGAARVAPLWPPHVSSPPSRSQG